MDKKLAITLVLTAIVVSLFATYTSSQIIPPTALSGFNYYREITITNSSTEDLTDYQIKLTIDTQSLISDGKMNPDCSDIRFTDSLDNPLPYYLESGCNTPNTVIWVKVPSIPASSTTTILFYYGNPSASSESDPSNVFDFYEDFETWSGWSNHGVGAVTQECSDSHSGSCSLRKTSNNDPNGGLKPLGFTLDYPFVFEAHVKRTDYSGGTMDRIGVLDDSGNGYGPAYQHNSNQVGIDVRSGYSPSTTYYSSTTPTDPEYRWYFLQLVWNNGDMTATAWEEDGTLIGQATGHNTTYNSFTKVYVFGGHDYLVDDIRIRKYADPEPTYTIGPEQVPTPPPTLTLNVPSTAHVGSPVTISATSSYDSNSYDVNIDLYVDSFKVRTCTGATPLTCTLTYAFPFDGNHIVRAESYPISAPASVSVETATIYISPEAGEEAEKETTSRTVVRTVYVYQNPTTQSMFDISTPFATLGVLLIFSAIILYMSRRTTKH